MGPTVIVTVLLRSGWVSDVTDWSFAGSWKLAMRLKPNVPATVSDEIDSL